MSTSFTFRSRIILAGILIFSLVLVGKLFFVQIVHSATYSQSADRQYATPADDIYERGTIFFESKDGQLISAAAQTAGYKAAINPGKLKDAEDVYKKLSGIITLEHEDFISKAKKTDDPYEEVANHLGKDQADKISAKKFT